jgi:hypothetical protein
LLSSTAEEAAASTDKLLERALEAADSVLGAASLPETRLLLVALAAQKAAGHSKRKWADGMPASALRAARPRLDALRSVGKHWPSHELVTRTSRFLIAVEWLDRFSKAIAPRTLRSVMYDIECGGRRFNHYLERRKISDSEVLDEVGDELSRKGWTPEDVRAFVEEIPADRLRTYPAEELNRVAEHWRTWSPLVNCLRGLSPSSDEIDDRLQETLAQVFRLVGSALAGTPWYGRNDAVQEAILAEIQVPPDGKSGYGYEGAYPFWLARGATDRLRSRQRRSHRTKELPEALQAVPETETELSVELDLEWKSRIALVLTFFQPKVQCRVKAILNWALSNTDRPEWEEAEARLARLGSEEPHGGFWRRRWERQQRRRLERRRRTLRQRIAADVAGRFRLSRFFVPDRTEPCIERHFVHLRLLDILVRHLVTRWMPRLVREWKPYADDGVVRADDLLLGKSSSSSEAFETTLTQIGMGSFRTDLDQAQAVDLREDLFLFLNPQHLNEDRQLALAEVVPEFAVRRLVARFWDDAGAIRLPFRFPNETTAAPGTLLARWLPDLKAALPEPTREHPRRANSLV